MKIDASFELLAAHGEESGLRKTRVTLGLEHRKEVGQAGVVASLGELLCLDRLFGGSAQRVGLNSEGVGRRERQLDLGEGAENRLRPGRSELALLRLRQVDAGP